MKTTRLIIFATAALFISTIATAQTKATKKADDEFAVGGYTEAARLYKTAEVGVKDLTEKGRVFFQIAECYRLSTLFNMSEEWYGKSITAQYYNTNSEVYYNYAMALQEQGKFEEAISQLNKYLGKGGEKSKANDRIKSCQTAADKKAARPKLQVENMTDLNSPSFDYCLIASGKKDEYVFSSARKESTGSATDPITGQDFMDLFTSTKDKKGKWSTPVPVSDVINTTSHEAVAGFDKDFAMMFYTSCRYDNKERFACDIMVAKKSGAGYSETKNLNIIDRNADDSSKVGHPAMAPDGKYLFFASDMPGGKGGRDIWFMTYDKKSDTWSKPSNVGSINTKGDEMFPYIAADGTLYFSSNGRGGMGGLDIYKAEKTGDATFSAPVALEYPINSSSDDFGFILEEGNTESKFSGYFTSSRPGGKGLDDIYYFKEPPLEFTLVATVYDEKTGSPLADSDVTVKGSNGDDYKIKTDGNGGFTLDKTKVKPATTYTVSVQKPEYIGTGDKFSTVNIGVSTNFAREYFLKPVRVNEEYKMPTVLYPYNQDILLVDNEVNSQDSLNFLLDLMLENPKYVVQLEAHTDFRGDDKYNQDLSQRRAETCVKYLISKGIEAGRLKPVGKGEAEPRKLATAEGGFPAGTVLTEAYITALPADKQDGAHLLNRRTVFRIIDTNYVPKK